MSRVLLPLLAGLASGSLAMTWVERWWSTEAFGPATGGFVGAAVMLLAFAVGLRLRAKTPTRLLGAAVAALACFGAEDLVPVLGAARPDLGRGALTALGFLGALGASVAITPAAVRGPIAFVFGLGVGLYAEPAIARAATDLGGSALPLHAAFVVPIAASLVIGLLTLVRLPPTAGRAVEEVAIDAPADSATTAPNLLWWIIAGLVAAATASLTLLEVRFYRFSAGAAVGSTLAGVAIAAAIGASVRRWLPARPIWAGAAALTGAGVIVEGWRVGVSPHDAWSISAVVAAQTMTHADGDLVIHSFCGYDSFFSWRDLFSWLDRPSVPADVASFGARGVILAALAIGIAKPRSEPALRGASIGALIGIAATLIALPHFGASTAWGAIAALAITALAIALGTPGRGVVRIGAGVVVALGIGLAIGFHPAPTPTPPGHSAAAPPAPPAFGRAALELPIALRANARRILVLGAHASDRTEKTVTSLAAADTDVDVVNQRTHGRPARGLLRYSRGAYDLVIDLTPPGASIRAEMMHLEAVRDALAANGWAWRWLPLAPSNAMGPWTAQVVTAMRRVFPSSIGVWRSALDGPPTGFDIGLSACANDAPPTAPAFAAPRDPDAWRIVRDPVDALARYDGDDTVAAALAGPLGLITRASADAAFRDAPNAPSWPAALTTAATKTAATTRSALAFARDFRTTPAGAAGSTTGASTTGGATAREALARKALATCPTVPFVRAFIDRVGADLIAQHRIDDARRLYEDAARIAPDWAGAYIGRARLLFRHHPNFRKPQWEAFNTLLERALELDPTRADAWAYQGVYYYLGAGDAERARGCFENAYSLDPDLALTKRYLWQWVERDGRIVEAAHMLIDAHAADPRDVRTRDALFKIAPRLKLAGRSDLALSVLDRVAPAYDRDAGYYLTRSEVLEALGRIDDAIGAARKSCSLTEPIQGYFLHLYRLLKKGTREREASDTRAYIQKTFQIDPDAIGG